MKEDEGTILEWNDIPQVPDGDHGAVEIVPFKTLSLLEAFRPVWWNIGDRGFLLRPHEHPRIETASVKERHSQGYVSTEMQEQAQVEEGVVCSGGSSADCKTAVKDQEPDHLYGLSDACLLYTSPSPRDQRGSRMPSSA